MGIDAVGLGTPDWGSYGVQVIIPYTLREVISTMKAVWLVNVTRPQPTLLEPFEGSK